MAHAFNQSRAPARGRVCFILLTVVVLAVIAFTIPLIYTSTLSPQRWIDVSRAYGNVVLSAARGETPSRNRQPLPSRSRLLSSQQRASIDRDNSLNVKSKSRIVCQTGTMEGFVQMMRLLHADTGEGKPSALMRTCVLHNYCLRHSVQTNSVVELYPYYAGYAYTDAYLTPPLYTDLDERFQGRRGRRYAPIRARLQDFGLKTSHRPLRDESLILVSQEKVNPQLFHFVNEQLAPLLWMQRAVQLYGARDGSGKVYPTIVGDISQYDYQDEVLGASKIRPSKKDTKLNRLFRKAFKKHALDVMDTEKDVSIHNQGSRWNVTLASQVLGFQYTDLHRYPGAAAQNVPNRSPHAPSSPWTPRVNSGVTVAGNASQTTRGVSRNGPTTRQLLQVDSLATMSTSRRRQRNTGSATRSRGPHDRVERKLPHVQDASTTTLSRPKEHTYRGKSRASGVPRRNNESNSKSKVPRRKVLPWHKPSTREHKDRAGSRQGVDYTIQRQPKGRRRQVVDRCARTIVVGSSYFKFTYYHSPYTDSQLVTHMHDSSDPRISQVLPFARQWLIQQIAAGRPASLVCRNGDSVAQVMLINRRESRGIANMHSIVRLLEASLPDVTYRVVYLEDYSLLEQMRLFLCTDVVVGVIGSNLAFTFLQRAGSMLLEIIPERLKHDTFRQWEDAIGYIHRFIVAPQTPTTQELRKTPYKNITHSTAPADNIRTLLQYSMSPDPNTIVHHIREFYDHERQRKGEPR